MMRSTAASLARRQLNQLIAAPSRRVHPDVVGGNLCLPFIVFFILNFISQSSRRGREDKVPDKVQDEAGLRHGNICVIILDFIGFIILPGPGEGGHLR